MTTIAIVDDDPEILELLTRLFTTGGFQTVSVADGNEVMPVLARQPVDLVVLDLMLPGRDGIGLCPMIREKYGDLPIVMLTARDEEIDRVLGLEMGADDYVTKPFSGRELLARVKAVLRRSATSEARRQPVDEFRFENWRFRPANMELIDEADVAVPLSTSETELLLAFIRNARTPLSRDRLLDLTKGRVADIYDRSIDTQVSRLRRKLGDEGRNPQFIKTVWGRGYVFTAHVEAR